MADEKAEGGKKKGGGFKIILLMVVCGAASPFFMPTILLLLVGMTPTMVALFTDTERDRSTATSIGFMNFAGVTPFILDLMIKGQSMDNLMHILREPNNWLVMLGAAFVGWLILSSVPQAMTTFTLARGEAKLKILKQNLEQLKTTWGPDVATTKPLDKVAKGE